MKLVLEIKDLMIHFTYSEAKDSVDPLPSMTERLIGFMLRVAFVSFMSVQDPLKFPIVGRPFMEKSRKLSSSECYSKNEIILVK